MMMIKKDEWIVISRYNLSGTKQFKHTLKSWKDINGERVIYQGRRWLVRKATEEEVKQYLDK